MSGETLAMKAELDASGVATGFQQINSHLSQFGIQTSTASTSLGGLGTMLGTLANPMTAVAAGALAVGSALTASVGVAGNFQQSMANVTAIMGGSEAEMQAMSAAAREAGATTQYSATQAAEALSYMAGAGWNSTQATAGLKDTLTMAAAGGMDLAAAGDLMTGTIAQFNLQATDAGRVSNVLAAGASATNTSVSQLGQGMTVVGATANAFGMSLESTTAALGALSNGNIKGAEGGTALRGILASLATQSGPAAAALSELGLSAADVNPETNQLSDTMQLLEERGMTATQAIAIFGRENVSAATYLAAHSSELDGLQTSITGTTKASEMAAIQTNTYQGAMGELSSAIEEAEISLGDALLPTLTEGVKFFTDLVTVGTAAGKAIYDFAGDVSTALDPVKEAFSYTPMGMITGAVSDTASDVWGDLKEWAGIGDEAGSAVAKCVAGNKDLATAAADAMTSDTAKAATEEAADTFGDDYLKAIKDSKVSKELATYIASGFSDSEALAAYNNQNSNANDEYVRSFEYLGKQITLSLQKGGSGWFDAWKVGDTQMGATQQGGESYDPIKAFEMITGFPAPEEGTAAYYDLIGDSIAARKVELQEEMAKNKVDISTIFDTSKMDDGKLKSYLNTLAERLVDHADELAAKPELVEAGKKLIDAMLGSPSLENLDTVKSSLSLMLDSYDWSGTYGDLNTEFDKYQARLVAQIYDAKPVIESKMSELGEAATEALNGELTDDEKAILLAYEPQLEFLKANFPEEFKEAGGESTLALIDALKAGDYTAVGKYAAGLVKDGLLTEFNTTKFEELDFSEWIKAPNWDNIFDPSAYITNVFQPKVLEAASTALKDLSTGEDAAYASGNELIMSWKELMAIMPELFTPEQQQALKNYDGNLLKLSDTLDVLAQKTDENKTKMAEYKEALVWDPSSLFGQWQEGSESGVFFDSYIGASYGTNFENYLKRLAEQKSSVADSAERLAAAHRGEYIAPSVADLSLDIDTTQADTKLQNVESNINKIIELTSKPQYLEIQFVGDKNTATEANAQSTSSDSLEVQISTTEADLKLNNISQQISDIQSAADPLKVDADTTAAHKALDDLMADIAALRPKVRVEVDISADATEIQLLAEEAVSAALRNAQV